MKRIYIYLLSFYILSIPALAQQSDPEIATVNNKPIYRSEFEAAYKKNNLDNLAGKESIKDFFERYIDFKLNVEEAFAQKLDTAGNYQYQYSVFRSSLIQPYLEEKDFQENYIKQIYDRMQEDIDLNHVFIPFETGNKTIYAPDTLKTYKKSMEIRSKLQKNGFKDKSFVDNTANENIVFDLNKVNGHLGWITPYMLNKQVIDAAYSSPINEISKPIRSSDGYHIIQVLNRRPAIGKRTIEQVVFRYPSIPPEKADVDSVLHLVKNIRNQIKTGNDFQALCDAYTEAYGLGDKGCSFDEIGIDTKLPPNFINAVFELKNTGDISEPVSTMYGVHIIRLKEKNAIEPLDSMHEQLTMQIFKSAYSYYFSTELQEYLFQKYGLHIHKDVYKELTDLAGSISPENTDFISKVANKNAILFSIEDSLHYSTKEFSKFLKQKSHEFNSNETSQIEQLIGERPQIPYNFSPDRLSYYLHEFAARKLYEHVRETMENRQPEIKRKLQEFSEGLLLYAVKEKNVWNKTKSDEKGLTAFYEKNKTRYKWDSPHYKGYIIYCKNKEVKDECEKLLKNKKPDENIQLLLEKSFNSGSEKDIVVHKGLWSKGQNARIDYAVFKNSKDKPEDKKYPEFFTFGRLLKSPEELDDVRGEVESDYQDELEKQWSEYLHKKYKVEVNQTAFKTIRDE